MNPAITVVVSVVLMAAGLAACGEKPQRVMRETGATSASESREGQQRERTLKQGEAGRMNY